MSILTNSPSPNNWQAAEMKIGRKAAKKILDATFPEYRGRKIRVKFVDAVTFADTNWSGGTRSEYRLVRVDGRVGGAPYYAPWDARNWEGRSLELPVDALVVEHARFCGEDMGITIYAPLALEGRFLPADSGRSTALHQGRPQLEAELERERDDDATLFEGQNYNWMREYGEDW